MFSRLKGACELNRAGLLTDDCITLRPSSRWPRIATMRLPGTGSCLNCAINVLTPEQIEFLTERTGLSREELLAGLADQLPKAVDSLTPEGRIPAPQEMTRVAELS